MKLNATYHALLEYNQQAKMLMQSRTIEAMFLHQSLDRFFHNNKAAIDTAAEKLESLQKRCVETENDAPKMQAVLDKEGKETNRKTFVYKSEEHKKEYNEKMQEFLTSPCTILF